MKKFLVISAAVSLMSTAAFAASTATTTSPSTSASGSVSRASVRTISIPVAVTVQQQRARATALFGSVAAVGQTQNSINAATSITAVGSSLIH